MAYKMKGFSGFGNSPAKQYKKPTGPRAEKKPFDHEKQGKEISAMTSGIKADNAYISSGIPSPKAGYLGEKGRHKTKSPAKQEGPIPKKNIKLQKGEMEGTWLYEGDDKRERIVDLEDRAGFLTENDIPDTDDPKRKAQLIKTAKKLQHEADILRNRKTK